MFLLGPFVLVSQGIQEFKTGRFLYKAERRFDFISDSLIYSESVNNEYLDCNNLPCNLEVSKQHCWEYLSFTINPSVSNTSMKPPLKSKTQSHRCTLHFVKCNIKNTLLMLGDNASIHSLSGRYYFYGCTQQKDWLSSLVTCQVSIFPV